MHARMLHLGLSAQQIGMSLSETKTCVRFKTQPSEACTRFIHVLSEHLTYMLLVAGQSAVTRRVHCPCLPQRARACALASMIAKLVIKRPGSPFQEVARLSSAEAQVHHLHAEAGQARRAASDLTWYELTALCLSD